MAKYKTLDGHRFCKFKSITFHKGFLESEAWKVLTKSQIEVLIYIWSCLQWGKVKKKWLVANNGHIEISIIKMREKLGYSKATCTKAIHKLIEVGLITLTRVGQNKVCHMYKILYNEVSQEHERWRKYPEQNWKHECPTCPNNLVGKKTQFKSHPKKVDRIIDNQLTKVDRKSVNGIEKYSDSATIHE